MPNKKNSDVVYLPAIGTQGIKGEIIYDSKPVYENQSVKYQGFYRDKSTGEVKNQSLRHIRGRFVSTGAGTYSDSYTIKKRFIITSVTVWKDVTAGAIAAGGFYFGPATGPASMHIVMEWRHNGTIDCHAGQTFDFSAAPIVIENAYNNTFKVDLVALPTVNDTIAYHIAGWEED